MKTELQKIKESYGGYWNYDILDFHYLINSHFPPSTMLEEIKSKLPELINNYPSTQKVIAEKFAKLKEAEFFNEDNLIITNGSSEAIKFLNKAVGFSIIPYPTFNEFFNMPFIRFKAYPLKEENNFELDVDDLLKHIEVKKTGFLTTTDNFVIICNPNNPTGNIVKKEDIIQILKKGIGVIVDEAFIDFCPENSVEYLINKYSNLIVVKSLTKTHGIAGLRLGYILTCNEMIKEQIRARLPIWNVNSISEFFIEIFQKYQKDYLTSIDKIIQERDWMFEEIKKISFLEPYKPNANFIFCKTKINSKELSDFLFSKYRIILRDSLNQKDLKNDNYIRIGVRNHEDNKKLINALKEMGDKR